MTVIVDLYTKEKIDNYINEIYTFTYGIGDLHTMLTLHKYNVGYDSEDISGSTTGFRNLVLENPNLLYKTLNHYGEYMIRQINSRFSYKCKNCEKDLELEKKEDPRNSPGGLPDNWHRLVQDHDLKFRDNAWCKDSDIINQNNQSFKREEFWKRMINKIDGYIQLADNLISLPDNDLNYYILSNNIGSSPYEFNIYLKEQDFLDNYTEGGYMFDYDGYNASLDHTQFPGDAIMLITRVYNYDKYWTPRKSFNELKKFSLLMKKKIIEVNNLN